MAGFEPDESEDVEEELVEVGDVEAGWLAVEVLEFGIGIVEDVEAGWLAVEVVFDIAL